MSIKYFLISFLLTTTLAAQSSLRVMSYNIRLNVASDAENAWPERRDFLVDQVLYHSPDILGVQEALPEQINFLDKHLTTHNYLGEGRDGGDNGEYSAIFFNRKRLELVDGGTFWLSPTPDVVASKGWDAALPRICTYGRFLDRESKQEFMAFNTHFDHRGEEARKESARLILSMIDSLNEDSLPVVMTGDLNQTPESEVLSILKERMTDTYTAAARPLGPEGTFTGFNYEKPAERRIDYVLVSQKPRVEVVKYATLSDAREGRFASDHFAVVATLHLRPRPLITAHRGASGYELENTLPAFAKAVEMKADVIELDVFRIKDGTIVVHHDSKLDRLSDTTGEIEDMNLEELRQVRLKSGYGIPTLAEALHVIDHRVKVNVELKGSNTAEGSYRAIEAAIANEGYILSDFQVCSFKHDELRRMRQLNDDIVIAVLPHGDPIAAISVAKEVKATFMNPHYSAMNPESVATLHDAGLLINCWTVNSREVIRKLLDLGVDGMITNYPDRVWEEWRNQE